MNTRKLIKKITPKIILNFCKKWYKIYLQNHPKVAIKVYLKRSTGVKMDFRHPKDLNQKINWLKLYGDTSRWAMFADKWEVRTYVSDKGLADLLINSYGHWNDANHIDFKTLDYPCVIKANHGCAMNMYLHECPSKEEISSIIFKLNKWLNTPFADVCAEPHYSRIKPCLLAEELLEEQNPISTSLIDYKVFAFNGTPACIMTCSNRTKEHLELGLYDLEWNFHPEHLIFNTHYIKGTLFGKIPKPRNLQKMINAASILSKDEPQARIDFYEVNGKLYFGEITMTSQGGYMPYFTKSFLLKLGNMCKLPID